MKTTSLYGDIDSVYLNRPLHPEEMKKIVDRALETLEPVKNKFSVIVYTGQSGALVAPTVAYLLGKPVILVRKHTDAASSHSHRLVEGLSDGFKHKYLMIDDFINTEKTVRRVRTTMKRFRPEMKPWKVYVYSNAELRDFPPAFPNEMESFFPEGVEDHV